MSYISEVPEFLDLYITNLHSMWDLILYQIGVAIFILLFWFHKPKPVVAEIVTPPPNKRASQTDGKWNY